MSKPISQEEASERVMNHFAMMSAYWASLPDKTSLERCNGLAFSILSMLDGCSMALPRIELVVRPHPDDQSFAQQNKEDWFIDGQVLDDVTHEAWSKFERQVVIKA